MNLSTCGLASAEASAPDPSTHVISIRSPGAPVAALQPGWGAVTFVAAADQIGVAPPADVVDRIVAAVVAARTAGADLLVHCEMGVSRSVGTARAIAEILDLPYEHPHRGNRAWHDQIGLALHRVVFSLKAQAAAR